jgi:DNA-binding NtrC family response regulator
VDFESLATYQSLLLGGPVSTYPLFTLLAIDDNPQNLQVVSDALAQKGLHVLTSDNLESGSSTFIQIRPRIVLLNLGISKVSGMELLGRMLQVDPGVEAIVITEDSSADFAVDAIKRGARDCLVEPLNVEKLCASIDRLIGEAQQRQKTAQLDQELLDVYRFEGIVGRSPLMLELFAKIRRIAPHFRTVLVTGATGTGKELVAHALHRLSPASRGRFVVCNCSSIVDTLVETELFGHVRGAFTGALQDKPGIFEHADRGTIFLDEVGELSLAAQARLLRVLQNRQVQRVGSVSQKEIDVRVVAATHRDLKTMVEDGKFREDLYYRLAVIEVQLPTLASRREDMPLLVRHFIEKLSREYGKSIAGLTRRTQVRFANYSWPGNVRELENVIGGGCMMTDCNLIDIDDLPERFRGPLIRERSTEDALLPLEEVQRRHVLRVLEEVGGNKARAAEILGIGRATIYQLLSRMKVADRTDDRTA